MIERLNELNHMTIHRVEADTFKTYGRVISNFDFKPLETCLIQETEIPKENNTYVASFEKMEALDIKEKIATTLYGGLDIQIGYCNGKNSTYNGFEYHKCSEILVAGTDLMLVLGHTWDMSNNTYKVEDAEVFFVAKGTAIELYQTTLHLSPCKVSDEGFKAVIILLKGTNDPNFKTQLCDEQEHEILLFKNKWVIAHKDREPLIKSGAVAGLIGENIALKY